MTARKRLLALGIEGVLVVDAAMHLLWLTGSTWPAGDVRALSYALLGMDVSFAPRVLLPLIALALTTLVVIHLRARTGRESRLYWPLQLGTLAFGAFVTARALAGIAWILGLGGPADHRQFYLLNLFAYTPLCLALAFAVLALARTEAWSRRLPAWAA
jgi:hypothetical protein